ncbi:unnamed protein product [Sphagnum tenellum]
MSESGQGLSIRVEKVRGIVNKFDSNRDGCINRIEMAALLIAVNPRVNKEGMEAILEQIFSPSYVGEFIEEPKGLSLEGLLRMYDDGAGDLDRDFDALGLHLESTTEDATQEPNNAAAETKVRPPTTEASGAESWLLAASIADSRTSANAAKWSSNSGSWASYPKHGIAYDDTCRRRCYCSCFFLVVKVAGTMSQVCEALIQAARRQHNTDKNDV